MEVYEKMTLIIYIVYCCFRILNENIKMLSDVSEKWKRKSEHRLLDDSYEEIYFWYGL